MLMILQLQSWCKLAETETAHQTVIENRNACADVLLCWRWSSCSEFGAAKTLNRYVAA